MKWSDYQVIANFLSPKTMFDKFCWVLTVLIIKIDKIFTPILF